MLLAIQLKLDDVANSILDHDKLLDHNECNLKVNINLKNCRGESAICFATWYKMNAIAERLLEMGAQLNAKILIEREGRRSPLERSPLEHAIISKQEDLAIAI